MSDSANQVLADFFNLDADGIAVIEGYVQAGQTLTDALGGGSVDLSAYEGESFSLTATAEAITSYLKSSAENSVLSFEFLGLGSQINLSASQSISMSSGSEDETDPLGIYFEAMLGNFTIKALGDGNTVFIQAAEDTGAVEVSAASLVLSGLVNAQIRSDSTIALVVNDITKIIADTDGIGFNDAVPSIPELPAVPLAQDVADALVTLGLCTQAV